MHEHRALEDLEKYPERRAVYEALVSLHKEGHPALAQYVATVVSPSGMTLREAASVLGLSYQRVAQLRDRGLKQRLSDSARLDLTWWPVLAPQPIRTQRTAPIQQDALFRLRKLNRAAKQYRYGQDPGSTLAFYRAVKRLHEAGVSYASMARALDENPRVFVQRLARWGVTEGTHGRRLTLPAQGITVKKRKKEREKDERKQRRQRQKARNAARMARKRGGGAK